MLEKVTSGIYVRVLPLYQPELSDLAKQHFVFSYHIEIENQSQFPIQLLKRHWEIFDSGSTSKVINGRGVVGKTPIIQINKSFCYSSAVSLQSEIGSMYGHYVMKDLVSNTIFNVDVPMFQLIVPAKLN